MGGNSGPRDLLRERADDRSAIFGATEKFAAVSFVEARARTVLHAGGSGAPAAGRRPGQQTLPVALSRMSTRSARRSASARNEFTVIGVLGKRPSPGGFDVGADDFVVIPYTTQEKFYGKVPRSERQHGGNIGPRFRSAMIVIVPRDDVTREQAMARGRSSDAHPPQPEARRAERLRPRHAGRDAEGVGSVQPGDVPRARRDLSIALMVGGIGVMAIMMISVTERTREIGVRKALGARRREILWQFLIEAAFLTSAGGVLGIIFGSAIGLFVHWFSGFPVSLPWWSFALGIGFSASVGIFFGLFPAIKASRLDPIEALRYE